MLERITIKSNSGPYDVEFAPNLLNNFVASEEGVTHYLVDSNVARMYTNQLASVLSDPYTLLIEATEDNKSIDSIIPVIEQLVNNNFKRDHLLLAIGGGIVQDITCFIASTLLRGVEWRFVPTTLLAQADSCIGSKSSINLGNVKNILGTFLPPKKIWICHEFLNTLERKDIQSGIGEILKVHAIAGPEAFDLLKQDFSKLISDRTTLLHYIKEALLIKRKYIEVDEYDKSSRNIFNYGHSFGHAIESATNFRVPHGVAVTIGMDMANHIAVMRGHLPAEHRDRMHDVLSQNYFDFKNIPINPDSMMRALLKDKKNTATELMLIFPVGEKASMQRVSVAPEEDFYSQCVQFLQGIGA